MYLAEFLWPHDCGTIEQAGYEFANARTEEYRKLWWDILVKRIQIDVLECQLEGKQEDE